MSVNTQQKNRIATERLAADFARRIERLKTETLPKALDEIGQAAVAHSVITKTYQNKTGRGVRSHFFEVVAPGESKNIEYDSGRGDTTVTTFASPNNEFTLLLGAKMFYLKFVEAKYGFDVMIQTFLHLRRNGVKLLKDKLKSAKLF